MPTGLDMGVAEKDSDTKDAHPSKENDNKENGNSMVIHNNLYPTACSNTVTVKSVIVKKTTNVTSIEMRSSGTVPKNGDIQNYLSTATLKI